MTKLRLFFLFVPFLHLACEEDPYMELVTDFSYKEYADSIVFENTSEEWEQCIWYFGDGDSVINEANPTHVYETQGKYLVRLVVWSYERGNREVEKLVGRERKKYPAPKLVGSADWESQQIEVENYYDDHRSGQYRLLFLRLSHDESFTESGIAGAQYSSLDGSYVTGFNSTYGALINTSPEGEISGLEPESTYFLKTVFISRNSGSNADTSVSHVISFTTEPRP